MTPRGSRRAGSSKMGKGVASSSQPSHDLYELSLAAIDVRQRLEAELAEGGRSIIPDRRIDIPEAIAQTVGYRTLYRLASKRNWVWYSSNRFKGYDVSLLQEFYTGFIDLEEKNGVLVRGLIIPWTPESISSFIHFGQREFAGSNHAYLYSRASRGIGRHITDVICNREYRYPEIGAEPARIRQSDLSIEAKVMMKFCIFNLIPRKNDSWIQPYYAE